MDRDRNRAAYAQARIDEINDEARAKAANRDPQPRRRADQRLAAASTTPRTGHDAPPPGRDPAGPAR